ncbi:unnamed protein product [[Candida] boidinii]|nr:unnamed protein product [[Candida] boidinii]
MNLSDRNSAITILGRVMYSVNSNIFQPPENAESIQPMRALLAGAAKVSTVNFLDYPAAIADSSQRHSQRHSRFLIMLNIRTPQRAADS